MSDSKSLEDEIKYLSVLIQRHKEKSGSQRPVSDLSKYKWTNSKQDRVSTSVEIPKSKPLRQSSSHLRKASSKHANVSNKFVKVNARYPSSTVPKKTGINFDPKFKWTRSADNVSLPTISNSASINVPSFSELSRHKMQLNSLKTAVSTSALNSSMQVTYSQYKYSNNATSSTVPPTNTSVTTSTAMKRRHISPSPRRAWASPHKVRNKRFMVQNGNNFEPNHRNPYKLQRDSKVVLPSNRKRSPTAKIHHARKSGRNNSFSKRRKIVDSSTHITLSRVALEGLLKKHSSTPKQALANRVVIKSHEVSRIKKQHQGKKRQHCLYYGRFGKCMRGDSCSFIHDPSRIAVCTRFLRGTCRNQNCSFSHKVEKEKTPVCLFFLRGKCTVPDCPYLHVFLGKDAPVCQRFASTGYCPNADKCKAQHVKCCPEFYETGKCQKAKACKLPHLKLTTFREKINKRKEDLVDGPSTDTQIGSLNKRDEMKMTPNLASAPVASGPEFLSLNVDAPEPINKPIRREPTLVKPRLGKLKPKPSSQ